MRALLLLASLLSAALSSAQGYSVEGSGGPGDLSTRLAAAAASWNEAAEEAELEEMPGAATDFTFGDPDLLGPDLVSATLVREGEEGFEVRVNPATIDEFPQALLHELGLLLGLPADSTGGVMNPALSAETPDEPGEADVEALVAALARAGGDIDGDGDVDIFDLAALGRAYGQQGVNLAADLDDDGEVDADDVALLRENYTFTEPQPVEPAEGTTEGAADDEAADGQLQLPGSEDDAPD